MNLLTGTRRALLRQKKVWSLQFYKENDGITFGSGANIDDLFTADATLETWMCPTAIPTSVAYILTKNGGGTVDGFRIAISNTLSVIVAAFFATSDLNINAGVLTVGRLTHIALDWEIATLTARLFIDGVFIAQDTAIGAYLTDAARNLIVNGVIGVGTVDDKMKIGPIRLSSSRRYTGASFNPPTMNHWPENDATAQLITRMNDAAGVTVTDYSGNGYDGTVTFGANTRWYHGPAR